VNINLICTILYHASLEVYISLSTAAANQRCMLYLRNIRCSSTESDIFEWCGCII